jgi:hypothetical protein
MKPSVLYEAFSTAWSLQYYMKPSVLYEAFSTIWSLQYYMKPSVLHKTFSTAWSLQYCMKPSVLHEAFSTAWSLQYYMKPSVLYEAFSTAWSLQYYMKPSVLHETGDLHGRYDSWIVTPRTLWILPSNICFRTMTVITYLTQNTFQRATMWDNTVLQTTATIFWISDFERWGKNADMWNNGATAQHILSLRSREKWVFVELHAPTTLTPRESPWYSLCRKVGGH